MTPGIAERVLMLQFVLSYLLERNLQTQFKWNKNIFIKLNLVLYYNQTG